MKKNNNWMYILGFVFLVFMWANKCDSDFRKKVASNGNSSDSCESATGVEEVKSCAVGIWTSTPTGDVWKRIVIKGNGTYELYEATPQNGKWESTPDRTGSYDITEARFSDTGKKYVTVNLLESGISDYRLVFDGNCALEINGNYENISKGDKNPWN